MLQIVCDYVYLGRDSADRCPYNSLKFLYVFIGELFTKNCFPEILMFSVAVGEKILETTESKLLLCGIWLDLSSKPQTNLIPHKLLHRDVCLD